MTDQQRTKIADYLDGMMTLSGVVGIPIGGIILREEDRSMCAQLFQEAGWMVLDVDVKDSPQETIASIAPLLTEGRAFALNVIHVMPEIVTFLQSIVQDGRIVSPSDDSESMSVSRQSKVACLITETQYESSKFKDLLSSICRLDQQ